MLETGFNLYCLPTPVIQDANGQQSGYVDQTVLLDNFNQPILDNFGVYITQN